MTATGGLTHFDAKGSAHMVDVSDKAVTARVAVATGCIKMARETLDLIIEGQAKKGDVLGVARLAGIMGAKKTAELIPLCHSLGLDSASLQFDYPSPRMLRIESCVTVRAKTGVEMEALTAVSVAALTVYDMCKAIDRSMEIQSIRLLEKLGGRSGHYQRET